MKFKDMPCFMVASTGAKDDDNVDTITTNNNATVDDHVSATENVECEGAEKVSHGI